MKINYNEPVMNFDGTPFKDEKETTMTLKKAIFMACTASVSGDEALTPMDKYRVGEIAFVASKELDLTAEQVATVKERLGKGQFTPTFVFAVHNMLENPVEPKA